MTGEPKPAQFPGASIPGFAAGVVPTRAVVWDGLGLSVPSDWEPARLGFGYMMLENPAGPKLTLRWQRLKKALGPEKVLKRLARQKILKPSGKPQGAVAAMLSALSGECSAIACADATGHGADAVLFVLPGESLAVLAAPHALPDEKTAPWKASVASLTASSSGAFRLFDVCGEAPDGFRLTAFSVQLGHFHFQFSFRGEVLEYYRFAPSEVILRGKTFDSWAGGVFSQTLGRTRPFETGYFEGNPSVRYSDNCPEGLAGVVRALTARFFTGARFARAMAWRPDGFKILAAVARHKGGLSPENFEEVCRRYVVQAS